jgi:YbgC/YbaW family acyl-CoA thioester hydrolase
MQNSGSGEQGAEERRVTSEYRLQRRVQYYETDAAGIVHFSWFFRYLEEAEHALWREAGLSIAPLGTEIGWPRVAAAFSYHRPLKFEDEFEVHIRIAEIGEKTIRYAGVLTCCGAKIATGSLTVACVIRQPDNTLKSVPIPAEIAARFQVAAAPVSDGS